MLDPERHWAPTCRALSLEELIDKPEYATAVLRGAAVSTLHPIFTERIASLPLADLKERLSAEDTIYSAIASPVEVVDDPQVHANGYMPRHPDHPRARLSSSPMQFDGQGLEIRQGAPAIGEHTDEVFAELGMTADEIARLRAAGALA
jgi:crotonobetainyl-CoA:carnitine CoA-transferase CaiB-like acyl-CoA transferase